MLEDQAIGGCVPDSAGAPSALECAGLDAEVLPDPGTGLLPVPDPAVVDSARLRLAAHRVLSARKPSRNGPLGPAEDIRGIRAVIESARDEAVRPADVLDVGAALVVLCDLRRYLDGLEADLLDAAQRVDLGWDVIAAIIGIPADEAERRHRALRAQQGSP